MLSQEGRFWNGRWLAGGAGKPLAGATVAADLPDGKRSELTTGSDGKVTFNDVDWSRGATDLTGYAKGHVLRSLLGVTADDGDQSLYLLLPESPPKTIAVSGALKNVDSTSTYNMVGTSIWGSYVSIKTPSYSTTVEEGKPFTVYAYQKRYEKLGGRDVKGDILSATKADHAGSTSAVTVDLDFADATKAVPLTTVKQTVSLPTDVSSKIGKGSISFYHTRRLTGAFLGGVTNVTEGTNNTFAVEGEYFKLGDGQDVVTTHQASLAGGLFSYIDSSGYPKDGATISGFIDVPVSTTMFNGAVPRDQPVVWNSSEVKAIPQLILRNATGQRTAWLVEATPKATSLTIPALPSTASASEVFGTSGGPVPARVQLCGERDPTKQLCTRRSVGPMFPLQAVPKSTVTLKCNVSDSATGSPLDGVKACVLDDASVPCATSDTSGKVTLPGIPNDRDLLVTLEKAGYATLAGMHGKETVDVSIDIGLESTATQKNLEGELGFTLDPKRGVVQVGVWPGIAGAAGVAIELAPPAGKGPYYYDVNRKIDKTLKATSGQGFGLIFDVPAGEHDLTVTKQGAKCFIVMGLGWSSKTATARVKVIAGKWTNVAVTCL